MSGDFLAEIGRERLERVRRDASRVPLERLREEAEARRGDRRSLLAAVRRTQGAPIQVIAEAKQASPSAGTIREGYDPAALAAAYLEAGASAISVLTEPERFRGSIEHLAAVRARVEAPLLLKDFVVHERQLYEARARGADAALLIVGLLAPGQLRDYAALCAEIGLEVLVEVHEARELDRALSAPGPAAIGVNNRDLRTLEVRRGHAESILPRVPADRVRIAESGYREREEILGLERIGADAVLIGEALLRHGDVRAGFVHLFGARERSGAGGDGEAGGKA
ncbi:MAG TPA: indole-3-glycerol phosphate synthase TrpC [Candidatus Eisenbacteria bacterium]|nr:indole-3-glycerol phosphate synthase TrpC [Candidatus Eisenbacteria bacterium]